MASSGKKGLVFSGLKTHLTVITLKRRVHLPQPSLEDVLLSRQNYLRMERRLMTMSKSQPSLQMGEFGHRGLAIISFKWC